VPDAPLDEAPPDVVRPLVPVPPPAQRPELLQGGEQQSLSVAHVEPGLTQTAAAPSSAGPPSLPAVAQIPERQKLPSPQSRSTSHAASFLLQATAATSAASTTARKTARAGTPAL
jgi:hypothetical protein